MSALPPCPQCKSTYTYEDGGQYLCPECAHEWVPGVTASDDEGLVVRDAHGNLLADQGPQGQGRFWFAKGRDAGERDPADLR